MQREASPSPRYMPSRQRSLPALAAAAVLAVLLLGAGCGGAPQPLQEPRPQSEPVPPASPGDGMLLQRLDQYLGHGLDRLEHGAVAEGISQLVSVLAEARAAGSGSPQVKELVDTAQTELGKVEAGLSLEPGPEWLDANKNQITASSVKVGGEGTLEPSIILTYNFGSGKALVTGAPVFFEFIKGSGLLTSSVATNDYGQANCSIARLDDPNQETVVRASLVYRVKDYTYRFEAVSRDFVYVPPARRATIVVLERAGDYVAQDPVILDAVYNGLGEVGLEFSQYNGLLLGQEFMRVFGGDPDSIRRMGVEKEVSYLVMVLNDTYSVDQVELDGRKYNIFKSRTTATTRIIRVSDGKILYSGTVQGIAGQGGRADRAVIDGLRRAAEAMADKLRAEVGKINQALSGNE